jgi:ankyrin repeat protein
VKYSTQAGQNALSFAARNNHNALGKFLIDELKSSSRYIDSHGVGFQYERGRTSLHCVAAEGNMDLALALLEAGWDLNGGECQFTPVLDAIYHKHEHIAKFLIERGSRIDQELLRPAAEYGLIDLARILLSKGVDATALSYGQSALEAAVTTEHNPEGRFELVKLLLENGANVRTDRGEPLALWATVSGYEDVTILLIEADAPLDGKRDGGATIVHYAAEVGYLGVIRALVAKGAQLNVLDNHGRTPLHLAASGGHSEVLKVLLEAEDGEWVDRKNRSEDTALHNAVTANSLEAARILVEHGASMTCQTYHGYTCTSPLAQAVNERRAPIVRLFIDKVAAPDEKIHGNVIQAAIEGGDLATIKALLSADSKLHRRIMNTLPKQ